MRLIREIKNRARQAAPQVLAACMVAYFAYHAMNGDRGFYAWIMLKQERAQVLMTAESLQRQRAELETRAALLRGHALEPDLLEERAQAILNYGTQQDHVIFLPPELQRNGEPL
ncbi:septum formation initiator family protein [Pelagibius litoralis]|uniref:Septum formation initiator family protein n=1 Tax=Pelagibius litoralis TaxID=374515 RepID=A0A967EWL5_9PROT|nr:septum formation initiator family protein [Pelagibius litoralis]NIA67338.1 septum formation initiator family protein [Pelagibius litoralis]